MAFSSPLLKQIVPGIILLLFTLRALEPKIDEDTWWHLRVGEEIFSTRHFPEFDSFSQVGFEEHRPWIAYSWLYETLLFTAFRTFDLEGILLLRWVLVLLVFVSWSRLLFRQVETPVHLLLYFLGMLAILPMMSAERPWHLTLLGMALLLTQLETAKLRSSLRTRGNVLLIFVLWSNLHIQFVLGLGILMLHCLSAILKKEECRARVILLLIAFLGTFVNPYHFRLYGVVWEYATQLAPLSLVAELRPPQWGLWFNQILLFLLALGLIQIVRRGVALGELSLWLAGAFFSLRMQRDFWFGVLISMFLCLRAETRPERDADDRQPNWMVLSIASFGLFLALLLNPWRTPLREVQERYYPFTALEKIRERNLSGPIFNEFNWGGFLIFHLREMPVSIDGRTNLYGDERMIRSFATWAALPGWERDPDLRQAKLILGPKTQRLTEILLEDARWKVLFEDDQGVLFSRD